MQDQPTLAQIAYDAYAVMHRLFLDGQAAPPAWETLSIKEHAAWQYALEKALEAHHPGQERILMSEPRTPAQIAYAATGGRCCPACKGTDIANGNETTFTSCTIRRVFLCEDCGAGWKAVYTLSGYEDLRLPVRQRGAAICAVCSATLEAGAVYCPNHPTAQVCILLEDTDVPGHP